MPKLGSTVTFHFAPTSAHFDDCEASKRGEPCDCVVRRFVGRPATVLEIHEDGSCDLDVAFEDEDVELLGISKKEMVDGEWTSMRATTKDLPVQHSVRQYAGKGTPTDLGDSGTWTE